MTIENRSYEIEQIDLGAYRLRAIEMSDAQDIYAYLGIDEITEHLALNRHRNVAETMRYIELVSRLNTKHRQMDWALEEKNTKRVLGMITAVARSREGEVMELGYAIHPDYRQRGIMTEAAAAVCGYLFHSTVCHRIEAKVLPGNAASIRVLEKCGFEHEGTRKKGQRFHGEWRDIMDWSLLREAWEKMQPKDPAEGWEKIRQAKCFALDMDGTVYLGDEVLPGAIELIRYLRDRGIRPVFLTNNSSRNIDTYVTRLNGMGFEVKREDILSSGEAAAGYLKRHFPGKCVYVMGNENLITEIAQAGIEVVKTDAEVVLTGFDTTLDYEKLTVTCDYVRAGLPYIATHPDLNCPVKGGFIPDLGAMTALIEKSAGRLPDVVIGKPYEEIARYLLEKTGLQKEEVVMVGDRLYTDIATGVNFGMPSVLVLSGETRREQLQGSMIQPDLVLRGVDELLEGLRG